MAESKEPYSPSERKKSIPGRAKKGETGGTQSFEGQTT